MLVDFTVKNFRSIEKPITFSMERINKLKEKELDATNIIETGVKDIQLLKTAAIYGANASGKSNVLRALDHMKFLVATSAKESQKGEEIAYEPFAFSQESKTSPTVLEIRFILNHKLYRYGFEVTRQTFTAEWLFENEKELFTREGQTIECSNRFEEGDGLEKRTRENSLFLSVCAQWDGDISGNILENFFGKIRTMNHVEGIPGLTAKLLEEKETRAVIFKFLNAADIGITGIIVEDEKPSEGLLKHSIEMQASIKRALLEKAFEENDSEARVKTIKMCHGDKDKALPLSEESDGTRKLFGMIGPIIQAIANSEILVIDELNDRLHPLLARTLVKIMHSGYNKTAQLIFATHDTNMLSNDLFRRDQIWFTEKDREMRTDLYSLADYKLADGGKVRKDASYAKDYLKGRYGAIPYFGEFPYSNEEG